MIRGFRDCRAGQATVGPCLFVFVRLTRAIAGLAVEGQRLPETADCPPGPLVDQVLSSTSALFPPVQTTGLPATVQVMT